MVESGTPWYGSIQLVEAHRNIPRRTGFDNSEQSYSSAVSWARGKLACFQDQTSVSPVLL
uniref:Uncharacterized protein n=1 Tax=Meloidogyne enterolobii TaxID=390850 RepID=A0A6V7U6U6_MELEN|nr:unnamed protein product [Meloidogyne enterolobii]